MTTTKLATQQKLSLEEWQIARIKAAIAQADANPDSLIPHEEVVNMMEKRFAARMVQFRARKSDSD